MGHSVSATKRERQNEKRQERNIANKRNLKKDMKKFLTEVQAKPEEAEKLLAAAHRSLDIAARKNAIPKQRAHRKKARLALLVNRLKAQKAGAKTS
ncbi:MAG: 30S ribosomal protein S20 [Planctomycetes bacterium]|nr:30S ribosomal protein S20 [Planctomycetota bacterium]